MADEELNDWLTAKLCIVKLRKRRRKTRGAGLPWKDTPKPAAAAAAPARPESRTPRAAEDNTFSQNADQAALAAVLRNGARAGVPFCEECMKAAGQG